MNLNDILVFYGTSNEVEKLFMAMDVFVPVSYTHLDVYKRQDIYIPLHVGAEGKESIGYQGDNTGENISKLNPYFCELT